MAEFLTTYPRRIGLLKGLQDFIRHEEIQFDHLSVIVRIRKEELIRTLFEEGFRKVDFENKKPFQIGTGFAKKLKSSLGDAFKVIKSTPRLDSHSSGS